MNAHAPRPAHASRRISGPTHAVALPAPPRRGTTGVFERIRALPDNRVVDRVLRGRACIWIIGVMLGGIVAMQVSLLKLNSSISHEHRAVEHARAHQRRPRDAGRPAVLRRPHRERRRQGGDGRAAGRRRRLPALAVRRTCGLALKRMTSPSDEAQQVMANGGYATAPRPRRDHAWRPPPWRRPRRPSRPSRPPPRPPRRRPRPPPAPTPTPTPQPVATQAPAATTAPTG